MNEQSKLMRELHAELEACGFKPGSTSYDKELRRRKVEICRENNAITSCWDCPKFDHCTLIKGHLRDLYAVKQ